MTREEAINKVLSVAKSKNGYLEKSASAYNANHNIVYEMTDGAGSDNRCEAWEVLKPSFNQSSNAWCQGFIHLIFQLAFGEELAKKLLYIDNWKASEPYNYYACASWSNNFEVHGARYQSSKAQIGDIIYFTKSHTGIVVDIRDGYVYTCEGNTSGASGVIRNGGGVVWGKKYKLGISDIKMYGRPNWSIVETFKPTIKNGYSDSIKGGDWCKQVQNRLNTIINAGLAEDGSCGELTEQAIKNFQSKYNLQIDGHFGPASWAKSEELLNTPSQCNNCRILELLNDCPKLRSL